jgi:parallel beta-helix repeat protein
VRRGLVAVCAALVPLAFALVTAAHDVPAVAAATTMFVDQANPACTDTGTGAQSQPFCTINAAAGKAQAGATVTVAAGTYTESVNVKNSGTAAAPIVFTAAPGADVVVTGKPNAFVVNTRSWITIQNFRITKTTSIGILVTSSSNVVLTGNDVSAAGQRVSGQTAQGIRLSKVTGATVSGNTSHDNSEAGIQVQDGSTNVLVSGNTTFGNARGYTRAAPGIDVRSSGNTVVGNRSHDNEDSGLQFYTGGGGNVVLDNVSYHNGDHGIDDLNAPNQVIVGNTVQGNVTSGINVEGTSSGAYVANNVSVDNGVNSPRTSGNIRIDPQSVGGAQLDTNLVFLSAGGSVMYVWGTTNYPSLVAFRTATGQEAHGLQGDPLWAAPGAGDFRLTAGSPAIDSANSGATGQPTTDFAGNARVDDPGTPNTGQGPRPYDDRGALEFQGVSSDAPPAAALTVTPASGSAPLAVTADASASTDADATPIASYRFDFGDGTVTAAQPAATAPHTYQGSGLFTVRVTVTDTAGNSATASATVNVSPAPPTTTTTTTTTTAPPTTTTTTAPPTTTTTTAPPTTTTTTAPPTTTTTTAPPTTTTTTAPPTTTTTTAPPTTTTTAPPTTTTTVPGPPNLVGNPGFETNTTGWGTVGTGVTLQRVAGGHSGAWQAQLTNGGTAPVEVTLNDSPNWIKTTSSGTYTLSAWVRADTAGATLKLKVREYVGTTNVGSTSTSITLSATWQQIQLTYVPVSPGSSTLDLNLYQSSAPVGASFYVDDVSITLG